MIKSDYLDAPLDKNELREIIFDLKQKLKNINFDAIAFCGNSGALVAPILAYELNKYILLVRKQAESCHSLYDVEGLYPGKKKYKYIILDDQIESGWTVKTIYKQINKYSSNLICAGIVLYLDGDSHPKSFKLGNKSVKIHRIN